MRQPVVLLHAGPMKTGTTYLQDLVLANREELLAAGVEFAGGRWLDQIRGVQDLLGLAQDDPVVAALSAGAWDRLSARMRASSARVCLLSMEFLAFASAEQARRAAADLGGTEVHAVLTVRDTAAVIPALWQTTVTSGGTDTWPEFARTVRRSMLGRGLAGAVLARRDRAAARVFREALDVPRMLRVWVRALGAARVHVVLVPGPGADADELWRRFARVLGVDAGVAPHRVDRANESLGMASAELVRRVNVALGLTRPTQQLLVKNDLGLSGLAARRQVEPRARLDRRTHRAALRWNARIGAELRRLGVEVVGDPADLPTRTAPTSRPGSGQPPEPSEEELLAAAEVGFRALRRTVRAELRRLPNKRRRRRVRRRLRRRLLAPPAWGDGAAAVDAAVTDLATLARAGIRLRGRRRARRRRRRAARRPPGAPA